MSHLSKIKTSLKNLNYLEKSLENLNINYTTIFEDENSVSNSPKLTIEQRKYNIEFIWNGIEFELVTDLSFWEQKFSVDEFLEKLLKQYSYQAIFNETENLGFKKVKEENDIILLERWV